MRTPKLVAHPGIKMSLTCAPWSSLIHVPVRWGGVKTWHSNLIIFPAVQQTQALLFHDQLPVGRGGVGWGNLRPGVDDESYRGRRKKEGKRWVAEGLSSSCRGIVRPNEDATMIYWYMIYNNEIYIYIWGRGQGGPFRGKNHVMSLGSPGIRAKARRL